MSPSASRTKTGTCVVGSFMMDLIAYAPRRPEPGETLVGTEFLKTPGGKGFNQAVACARSGMPTSMVGRVGEDDFGTEFLNMLRGEGIDNCGVSRDAETGTGVGMPVVSADGQNSIIIIPRANHSITPQHVRDQARLIEDAAVLLLQLELPMDAAIEAARIARTAGTCVVLNPAPYTELPTAIVDLCDVLVPNEVELAAWTGHDTASTEEVIRVAAELGAHHGVDLVVTLGSRGVLVAARDEEPQFIAAHRVHAIDTIGAGDVFCGYLCAQLCQGASLADAARVANVASAIAVTRPGGASSAPTRAEVEEFTTTHPTREDQR